MTWRACLAMLAAILGVSHVGFAATDRAGDASYWIGSACIVAAFGIVLCMAGKRKEAK